MMRNPMPALYRRLKRAGIDKKFLKKVVLPEWWVDEAAHDPATYMQVLAIISRSLMIKMDVLLNADAEIRPLPLPNGKHKRRV